MSTPATKSKIITLGMFSLLQPPLFSLELHFVKLTQTLYTEFHFSQNRLLC